MGKPIVYCHGCGKSLLEADFDGGRASHVDDRPYCSVCRKPEAPAFKPPSTTGRGPERSHARPRYLAGGTLTFAR